MNRRNFLLGASSLVAAAAMPRAAAEPITYQNHAIGVSWVEKSADEIMGDIKDMLVGIAQHDAKQGESCDVMVVPAGTYRLLAAKDLQMGQRVSAGDIMHHIQHQVNSATLHVVPEHNCMRLEDEGDFITAYSYHDPKFGDVYHDNSNGKVYGYVPKV